MHSWGLGETIFFLKVVVFEKNCALWRQQSDKASRMHMLYMFIKWSCLC